MTVPNSQNSDFILIVDDNPDNLSVLANTLKSGGYSVRVAADGESALELVDEELPALILLDVMMPGIDGFETCRRLKEQPSTLAVPVIFMTALSDHENKVQGLSLGAVDYLTKPFNEAEVFARVRIHLKLQNLLQMLQQQNQQLNREIEQRQAVEAMLQNLNNDLEQRVNLRTAELHQAMEKLQHTQVKMVQQEKLSVLGELMAGVAHEINNPMGCIANNIKFVQEYSKGLLEHLQLYKQSLPEPDEVILEHAEDIDLDFLTDDLPSLIQSMKTSSDTIRAISDSLRTFARRDQSQKKSFDLHEGIESTLLILKHRFKAEDNRPEIKVIKKFDNAPTVPCFPGQINQVVMNILANAIDAFDERNSSRRQTIQSQQLQPQEGSNGIQQIQSPCFQITITTQVQPESVMIRIQDNAGGMPEVVRSQIFDSLYTTKPMGKGTGLGLAIARQIVVDTHGGSLDCQSSLGQGTTFEIELPLR